MINGNSIGQCDVIVSFDTLEHLLHREIALMRMADNLSDDGWLLFSTPCGRDETKLYPSWEHHKVEYSHTDLFYFLSRFFKLIIQPQDDTFPAKHFWSETINATSTLYLNRMNPVICVSPIRTTPYSQKI